jgi:hypothetical protein
MPSNVHLEPILLQLVESQSTIVHFVQLVRYVPSMGKLLLQVTTLRLQVTYTRRVLLSNYSSLAQLVPLLI